MRKRWHIRVLKIFTTLSSTILFAVLFMLYFQIDNFHETSIETFEKEQEQIFTKLGQVTLNMYIKELNSLEVFVKNFLNFFLLIKNETSQSSQNQKFTNLNSHLNDLEKCQANVSQIKNKLEFKTILF